MDAQVLVVGGGPVGLTLSIALGRLGIRTLLVDKREAPGFLPKMERCNARTMEVFRRLGVAEQVRDAGYPRDHPMDVFIILSLLRPPLVHHPYPSVAELKEQARAENDGRHPLEPYQITSQYVLEPLLKGIAEGIEAVDVRFGSELVSFQQHADHVEATVSTAKGTEVLRAPYLIGCDGGGSTVRRIAGIELEGETLLDMQQALFRSDELYERLTMGKGRHYHIIDETPRSLVVQSDRRHFSMNARGADHDMPALFRRAVGPDVEFETVYTGHWTQRLMLADSYGSGRVLIAGDAAHLVVPTGGLGMNTGIGDADNLAWKLAAVLEGWGGPALLASYEAERRPVGARNIRTSGKAAAGRRTWWNAYRPELLEDTEEGDEARTEFARLASEQQRLTNDILGIELGYVYDGSPVIPSEPGATPAPDSLEYTPSTAPGARLPHLFLDDGRAVHDLIGPSYTFIGTGGASVAEAAAGLREAFARLGAPFEELELPGSTARDVYGYEHLLVRPDLHVVWRGSAPPKDPDGLAATVTGH